MKQLNKKAFTLIELLVVITIIGILATWATAVYTSQIQKGRDATRISSLEALRGWAEQYYQDSTQYPDKWASFSGITIYVPKLPLDPKSWDWTANTSFDYTYNVWADSNWISNQLYEFSSWLENTWNVTSKATKDWWDDNFRLEVWIILDAPLAISTNVVWKQALTTWINWNPTANTCVAAWWTSVAWWTACAAWNWTVMIIR